MNIRGTIYHCLNCHSHFIVEYKGETQTTFLGDLNIIIQRRLSELYKRPMDKFKDKLKGPYHQYLHDEAVCEPCYRKMNYPADLKAHFEELFAALGAVSDVSSSLNEFINARKTKIVEDYCSTLEFQQAAAIDEKAFKQAFGSLKKPFKKAVNQFISLASNSIASFFIKRISADRQIDTAYAEAKARSSEHKAKALSLARLCGEHYYTFTNVLSPQCLHCFIVCDSSVREPAEPSGGPVYYFYPRKLDRKRFDEVIHSTDWKYYLDQMEGDKISWIKSVKNALMKFC